MGRQSHIRYISGGVTAPKGFLASGVAVGIKYSGRKDVALIYSVHPATVAGVFTTNYVKAAPVLVGQKVVRSGVAQAIVTNSGCANACTGEGGYRDAVETARLTGHQLNMPAGRVIVCSTGAIGKRLPMDKIRKGISEAAIRLSPSGGQSAAQAILTTDLVTKEVAVEFSVGSHKVRIGGVAKGSGMIHPNMATMLAFITTDAKISRALLKTLLQGAVDESFHRVTVDKDQSTNDTVLLLANGASDVEIRPKTRALQLFQDGLTAVCIALSRMIARDGEGATRLIEIHVTGARDVQSAAKIARQIAGSDLVKTAVHGGDPNVGRILGAAGAADVPIDEKRLRLWVGPVHLVERGQILWQRESVARKEMRKDPVLFRLDLGLGRAQATAWGCDLSKDYVKINAEYRT